MINSRRESPGKYVKKDKNARIDSFYNGLKIEAKHNAIFDMNAAALNGSHISLAPVIMSHGLMSDQSLYSRHCLELASHGYIVFGIHHNDGSCSYTEKSNGEPVYFNKSAPFFDMNLR